MADFEGLAILYLQKIQFAVKSLLQGPQKDKKVDPCKPVHTTSAGGRHKSGSERLLQNHGNSEVQEGWVG